MYCGTLSDSTTDCTPQRAYIRTYTGETQTESIFVSVIFIYLEVNRSNKMQFVI